MNPLEVQLKHLKKDKALKKVIVQVGVIKKQRRGDLFMSLLRAIVGQQLSVKAADTIWSRFLALFGNKLPEPGLLLKISDNKLRSAGLSYQKAGYLKNIARFAIEQTLDYNLLKKKTDDELVDYLVQIKGVGRWTVEMLLMFELNRPDVFPKDDLGIQNGIKKLYKLSSEKKALLLEMEQIAENWRPYRTLACRYIWRFKDQ
ncbi:MAG TPA: DNA-3-methyladenine glycosylase [Bacteroidia bacterium]|nr:DNA-3-methyladenine glycosylase [Bacteroidia bacterium]